MMDRFTSAIDRLSGYLGKLTQWLTLLMVLLGAYNAIVRYLDRYTGWGLSSNTYIELQWYLFAIVFLVGSTYALRDDAHVRVDVLFARLSRRGRAWINVAGTVLFLIPFCVLMVLVSIPAVENSWAILEQSPDPGGLPRYPIRTLIPVAFVLILLQGLVLLVREAAVLRAADPPTGRDGSRDGGKREAGVPPDDDQPSVGEVE